MRWWGWGDPALAPALPAHALDFLREAVGAAQRPRAPVALERVALPEPRLPPRVAATLRDLLGEENVRDDRGARVLHAGGKGYTDLVRLRAGEPEGAPDAVLYPDSHEQVRAVLSACADASVAVVPFGGGTSVVGGVAPLRGEHAAVVTLDLRRLNGVHRLDIESRTVVVHAGTRLSALEGWLAGHGFTLGHFPQSFEYVCVGGSIASRSAGQASTGYGRIDANVRGLRFAAPAGEFDLPPMPPTAAGPAVRELLIGSEGALGVITGAALRVHPAPAQRVYEGVFFETFAGGVDAFRTLTQHDAAPEVARLSDEEETRLQIALAGSGGIKGRLGRAYLGLRGYAGGCLAILGFEGDEARLARRQARTLEIVRRHGGLPVGRSPGEAWLASRFSGPYLRDDLLTHGVMVETLETATPWSNLIALHEQVGQAIAGAMRARGTPGLVMCHVSHLYDTGASLYYTFLARQQEGREVEQWRAIKHAASAAIVTHGGTITHHHGVGRDHLAWMADEIGAEGVAALRALKAQLDPARIMNPGKLLP